jgi:uncharacterized protein YggE
VKNKVAVPGLLLAAALAAAALAYRPSAGLAQSPPSGTVTVTGEATVTVAPDRAQIQVGTDLLARTAAAAVAEDAARVRAILSALEKAGVPLKDLQTEGYSLNPNTVQPNGNAPPRIEGYWINDNLQITTANLADVGRYIDLAVAAGANQVNGVNFTAANSLSVTNRANAAAVANAHAQALVLAQAAGERLGAVRSMSIQNASPPVPMYMSLTAATAAPRIVPPSGVTESAQVTVVYRLLG